MYITKRCFVRIISYLTAAIVILGIIAAQGSVNSGNLKRQLEYNISADIENLTYSLDNINNTLQKGLYSGSAEMMAQLSAKLRSDAADAKAALSGLPVSELHLENTYKFLSQVGNYSKSLADKYSGGEAPSEEDRKNLYALSKYAKQLCDNMQTARQRLENGELSLERVTEVSYSAENEESPAYITDGFTEFENGFDNYPTLIYDGPFSDHIMEKQPEMLKNVGSVTIAKAEQIAKKAAGSELTHTDTNDEAGKMPSYVFSGGEEENITVSVTKNGGYISYMLKSRQVGEKSLTATSAIDKAFEYLNKLGIKDVTNTYYEIGGNVCTVNFAGKQDDVILYTDLIKVSVAMDNGEILGFDARGYLTNHRDRVISSPKISRSEAGGKLSTALNAEKSRLCIIPSEGQSELYCYEFNCTADDGTPILVYINADTGKEEQLLLLKIGAGGTLTV